MGKNHSVPHTKVPPWEEDLRALNKGRTALSIFLVLTVVVFGLLAKFGTYPLYKETYERFAWGDTHEDLEDMGMEALSGSGTGLSILGVPTHAYFRAYAPDSLREGSGLYDALFYYAIDPSAGIKGLMIYEMDLSAKECRKLVLQLSFHYGLIPDRQSNSPASPFGMAARIFAEPQDYGIGQIRSKTWYKGDRAISLTTFREPPFGRGSDRYALELIITPYPEELQPADEIASDPTPAPTAVPAAASPDPAAEAALREALAVLAPYYNKNADFTIWLAGEYAEADTIDSSGSDRVFRTQDLGKRLFIEADETNQAPLAAQTDEAIEQKVIQPILDWEKRFEHTDLYHGVFRTANTTWAKLSYALRGETGVLHYRGCDGAHSVNLRFFNDNGLFTESEELLCDWIAASYTPGRSDNPPRD